MLTKPLISIIIPTYNRAHLISETLNSILTQTYSNWECIVVDDGSTDKTEELIKEFIDRDDRFKYYHRPENRPKGPSSCRNYGFEMSKGDYVNFFDSDDIYKPFAFEKWLNQAENNCDAIISKTEFVDFNCKNIIKVFEVKSIKLIEDFFIGKINFFVCGPLWYKPFLKKQDVLFNESISNGDDWDFNLRMLYQKPNIKFLNEALVQNRLNPNSLSRERYKFNKQELKSYFDTLEYHLGELKKNETIKLKTVNNYIISIYLNYLLMALNKKNPIHFYIFKRLIVLEIKLVYLAQFIKTTIGYSSFRLFNKGYFFLKYR